MLQITITPTFIYIFWEIRQTSLKALNKQEEIVTAFGSCLALISMGNIENVMGMSQEGSTGAKGGVIERPLRHLHCILILGYKEFWKSSIEFARKLYMWYKNDYG